MRNVAVSRSRARCRELGEQEEVREIEALYLAAIRARERTLYIESQYLASRTIAEAIAARLREPDGPEIVLVYPAIGRRLARADGHGSARR